MKRFAAIVAICAGLLVGCSEPVPAERAEYIGEWHGGPISLVIFPGGRVLYKYQRDNFSKSLDLPLKEFKGDNFVVGVGFMSTEFVVTKPPHEEDGLWKMTVDGVEVTKTTPALPDVERNDGTAT